MDGLQNCITTFMGFQDCLNQSELKDLKINYTKYIFLLSKNGLSMILPNNGKVCGYSLYNNGLNLFYNLLLKKDDIMPLKLNHSLIYNNGNTVINLNIIKNYFFKNNKIEETLNVNEIAQNELNIHNNNSFNLNVIGNISENNNQEESSIKNNEFSNNQITLLINNDSSLNINISSNNHLLLNSIDNNQHIQELNDNNIQQLDNNNIQQLNNNNNNNNFVIENQANNIVDNNQHNSKPPYDINLYINNDKSLNVSSSSNDPNPPFLNSISSSSNDSVSSSSNLISSSSNDSASSSSNLIDTTTISESIDNEKIIFIGNVKIILNNNIITRMETEGNICSPNYPIISDEELKYYLKNGYSKNDKKNIFLYTFYYNLCKEKFYEIFTTKLFLLDKNFIEEFKIIVTFFNEDGFILNENILNWFIKNKLELQRKMFLSKIIQSKVPDKLEIFKKSDTDEYYETSEISIRITNIVFESKYSNKKNFHILYDSIDKFNLLNQVKEGLEVIIRKPK
jgi:hypothetical protein